MNITVMGSKNSRRPGANPLRNRDALSLALDLYRNPAMAGAVKAAPLPADMRNVIRVASSSDDEIVNMVEVQGSRPDELRAAAGFFIQQILFQSGHDPYRVLGLNRGATAQDVKDHKRMLLKWLHPDRNHNSWETGYFQRVTEAAKKLGLESTETTTPPAAPNQNLRPRSHGAPSRAQRPKPLPQKRIDWRNLSARLLRRLMGLSMLICLALAALMAASRAGLLSPDLPMAKSIQALMG